MANEQNLLKLIEKWVTDSDSLQSEARRLEQSDLSRHATAIAVLEASAHAIDRCILELENWN
jgi:hypothetical protein